VRSSELDQAVVTRDDTIATTRPEGRLGWVHDHPVLAFVGTAYALSWSLWALAGLLVGPLDAPRALAAVPFVLGGFGPPTAAWLVLRWTGGSVRDWARPILRWRVPARYYVFALGVPAAIYAVVNVALRLLGEPVEPGLVADRWPAYLATFAFTLTLGGAMEEPGWRGFALPRLQLRYSPLAATAILGLAWGIWHVPIYGTLGWLVPFVLAFLYTWLWNRTGSLLLCILLHASFTPAQEHLTLLARETHGTTDLAIAIAYLAAAGIVVALTRGRLGAGAAGPEPEVPA
jgi:uncharacterized protein